MEKNVIRTRSKVNYSYATIKITQSRLDKGLIAIPISLTEWFPDKNDTVQVYLSNSPVSQSKHYSSYRSSTRECRIGGMKEWFRQNNIKSGDEIVVQFIDKERFIYRLIPERNFLQTTKELQHNFDASENEQEASERIANLSEWTQSDKNKVVLNEYRRLIDTSPFADRHYIEKTTTRAREGVPANIRTLLEEIYKGHCQLCDFWFLKRDNRPYFEIHHINPSKGHHPKNLIVVCGNCHNQFEHASVKQDFDNDDWLIRVSFNEKIYTVKHVASVIKKEVFLKELFI